MHILEFNNIYDLLNSIDDNLVNVFSDNCVIGGGMITTHYSLKEHNLSSFSDFKFNKCIKYDEIDIFYITPILTEDNVEEYNKRNNQLLYLKSLYLDKKRFCPNHYPGYYKDDILKEEHYLIY